MSFFVALPEVCTLCSCWVVQSVFAGPYLTPEVRKQFTEDYKLFNEGLLALPIGLPGFAFWKATKAVPRIIAVLGDCARQVCCQMGSYLPQMAYALRCVLHGAGYC